MELVSIASLKGFKWWQRIQGGLLAVTAIASLNLLSNLGVEGEKNSMVFVVGAVGVVSIGLAALINGTILVRIRNEHEQNTTSIELPTTQRSVRAISSGQVEEEMFAAALI